MPTHKDDSPDLTDATLQPNGPGPLNGTPPDGRRDQQTQPTEEWGERYDAAKAIARGGKSDGAVPGAQPSPGS